MATPRYSDPRNRINHEYAVNARKRRGAILRRRQSRRAAERAETDWQRQWERQRRAARRAAMTAQRTAAPAGAQPPAQPGLMQRVLPYLQAPAATAQPMPPRPIHAPRPARGYEQRYNARRDARLRTARAAQHLISRGLGGSTVISPLIRRLSESLEQDYPHAG